MPAEFPAAPPRPSRLSAILSGALALVLLAAGLWVLRRELRQLSVAELRAAVDAIPTTSLLAAVGLTLADYLVLSGFDRLAQHHLGRLLPRWRSTVAAMTGFALSNAIGWNVVAGASVRYRFFTRWGLTAPELARVVASNVVGFWLGMAVLGGATLLLEPAPGMGLVPDGLARAVGAAALGSAGAYLFLGLAGWRRREPLYLRVGARRFNLPRPRVVLGQLLISVLHWSLAAAVLYVLLPASLGISYGGFIGVFLTAQLLGVASQVPAGLGVFEGVLLALLPRRSEADGLLPLLVVYRLVYYLLPLATGLAVLGMDGARRRR